MNSLISKIQHLSTQDGPGIRTTIFFKGCPLNCAWCHNPESISKNVILGFELDKCVNCNACLKVCKTGALSIINDNLVYDKSRCNLCLKCEDECFYNVISVAGINYSEDEIIKEILDDLPYYRNSNGGVTFSGGEPLLEKEFILRVMNKLEIFNISFCLETSLFVKLDETIISILEKCEYCFIDFKLYNSELHKMWTGTNNELIKENLKSLEKYNVNILLRTPVIEGVNDSKKELGEIAVFANSLKNVISYSLIPYHPLGLIKYKTFSIPIKYDNKSFFNSDKLKSLQLFIDNIMGDK